MQDLIGVTIGNYQVVEKLGRGGMANVYKAYHPALAVHRALKVIRPDLSDGENFNERFQREARAVAGLRHPNIVQVHDFGRHEDLFYMVMEFVEGEDLKVRIRRDGPIRPFSEALRIVQEVASALGYAHDRGLLHRDVKPDNVLLSKDGEAILADFGIAKIIESDDPKLTVTGTGIGTPDYMAPEVAMGRTETGASADLYALGVVLYEMLTARAPFAADTPLAILHKVLHDPVPAPREFTADIPDALQGVVLKAMAFETSDRYPDAESFIEACRQSLLGVGPGHQPELGGASAVGAVAVSAAGGVGTAQMPPPPPSPGYRTVPVEANAQGAPVATAPVIAESGNKRSNLGPAVLALLLFALVGASAFFAWRWFSGPDGLPQNSVTAEVLPLAEVGEPATEPALDISDSGQAAAAALPNGDQSGTPAGGSRIVEEGAGDRSVTTTETESQLPLAAPVRVGTSESASSSAGALGGESTVRRMPAESSRSRNWSPPEPSVRYAGEVRFGSAVLDSIEPEETVEFDIGVRRPTWIYFDIVYAIRPLVFTLYDGDGEQIFRQVGADLGPLRLEQPGLHRMTVESDADIPVRFEFRFTQVGS